MLATLKQLFSSTSPRHLAHEAYVQIVSQARQPVFYDSWQVEDSVDGRFDVIVLHLFLMLARCDKESSEEANEFSRQLSEVFFSDMDRSLREMGATDTGVGIRIKKMAQAFYGRMSVYRDTIMDGNALDETALAEALKRNVYREKPVAPEAVASLAAYMGRNYLALKTQPIDVLIGGVIHFSG